MAATLKSLGCPEQKLAIQHLGVNVEELPFRERRRDHHEPLRILMVGSFREKKGIPDGLRALALLHKDGVNVEATLIGDATAERRCVREKQRIFETLRDAGMELRVRLLGFQSHERMIEEAYRHHIFLSPSKTAGDGDAEGGAPVTLIEMAATGMPIVSTRHCDIPSIVNDGVTGLLAEEGDVHGLHMRLAELSDHPDRWGTMGAAGRHVVEERFNAAKLGPQLAGIYETFL
jgi:colanic acid/amylovoran biosynthesis glycosyltransferase